MMLVGAAIAVVSAFLPWASIGPFTAAGTVGDGQITLVLGAVLGGLGLAKMTGRGGSKVATAGVAVAVLIGSVGCYHLASSDDGVSVGVGVYGTVVAGVIGAIGSFRARRSPATSALAQQAPPPVTLPPAGWYPDHDREGGLRFWDGSSWTDQTATTNTDEPVLPAEP